MDYTSDMQIKTSRRSLPKGWQWAKLGDVAEYINGMAFKPTDWKTSGLPIIRIQNLTSSEAHFNHYQGEFDKRYLVEHGDLLISWSASLDAYIWQRGKAILNQHIFKAVENSQIITRDYLYYAVREAMDEIRLQVHGATMKHITRPEFLAIQIPLPPLDEQRRIASRLNEQLTTVESAHKAAEEQLQAAYQLPSMYLREVFDNHTANKWTKVRLGEILYLRKEVVHPHDNPKGPAVFVGLEHIESNTGVRIGSVDVEMSKLTGRKPKFYKGDIVYGYLRPYLNKVWIAEFDGLCSVDQYIYKVDDNKADTNFVAWFMRSPVYLERAPIDTSPGQLPRIRTEEVASVEINLPPLDEQRKISLQIMEKLSDTNNLINALESQLAEIESLPASLLREAFSGF
jgi:type I restriction enzyme S subunit